MQNHRKYGYTVDQDRLNVFLIASVAGGTGAGMFLDCAFLLKDINSNINITGILFLPSIFEHIKKIQPFIPKFQSNGYAFLMELDYFMAPKVGLDRHQETYNKFVFKWDEKEHLISKAPLYNVYFLDWENSSEKPLSHYTESFQMAAEFIFLEFCQSRFADEKRSIRANLEMFLIDETRFFETGSKGKEIFSQYFPNRYSTFGLSFIKLDIDRKKNAAAYFLGRSLAKFWDTSAEVSPAGVTHEVIAALVRSDQPGKSWNSETIKDFFLRRSDDKDRISTEFKNIKKEIEEEFDRKTVREMFELYNSELRAVFEKMSQKVREIWNSYIREADRRLSLGGDESEEISHNAEECFNKMKTSFTDKFHDLLSKPGTREGKRGIVWAREFLRESVRMLEKMRAEGFVDKPLPERRCPLEIDYPKEDRSLEKLLHCLEEARGIKIQPFERTAVRHYHDEVEATLKSYLNSAKGNLVQAIEGTQQELLMWYAIRYHNFICDKARLILNNLISYLSSEIRVGQGLDKHTETRGLEGHLNHYHQGLEELVQERDELFKAYNEDKPDVRYYNINLNTDDDWYLKRVQETLQTKYAAGHAMSWEDILDAETEAFFSDILKEVSKDMSIRKWGFHYLFETGSERIGNPEDWFFLGKDLDDFCFGRIEEFLLSTNADVEFQRLPEDKKKQILIDKSNMADAWISPSQWGNIFIKNVPQRRIIGVPSMKNTATATQAQREAQLFGEADSLSHEKGNLLFFSEFGPFPLFRIGGLDVYRKSYIEMYRDPNTPYQRHLDYQLIAKLRDILPPQNQDQAMRLFNVGLIFFEALLLGCLKVTENPEKREGQTTEKEIRFCPPPGRDRIGPVPLGINFNQAIRTLTNAENYVDLIKRQIKDKKNTLQIQRQNFYLETISLIHYYLDKVFPALIRSGEFGITEIKDNLHLILLGLREQYIEEYFRQRVGNHIDGDDSKIWDEIAQINLENISDVFPFEEKEAHGELRILKP